MEPIVVHFQGYRYLRMGSMRLGAAVNLSVWDVTHVQEAVKWANDQLRKKRRVFRDVSEKMDYVLFATDIPDVAKAQMMIRHKWENFSDGVPKLVEITDADQVGHNVVEDKPAAPPPPKPEEKK